MKIVKSLSPSPFLESLVVNCAPPPRTLILSCLVSVMFSSQLLSICREYVTAIRIKAAVAETKDTVSFLSFVLLRHAHRHTTL